MAQVSELGEDVFRARTAECGIRSAAGGCLRSAAGVRSAELCGAVRPAGVSRASRCLRSRPMSAECGVRIEWGLQTADGGAGRCLRSAERGVLRSAQFCSN